MVTTRNIVILSLAFVIVVVTMTWNVHQLQSRLIMSTALRTAEIYSLALRTFRTLYTSEVVEKANNFGLEASHDYVARDDAIPLPATLSMMLGEEIGRLSSGASSSLYSPYPFPWREREGNTLLDEFNKKAWEFLSANPNKPYFQFLENDNKEILLYATADLMIADCVDCHNTHPDSLKTDWKVGDVRGVLEVSLPLDVINSQTNIDLRSTIFTYVAVGLGLIVLISILMIRLQQHSKILDQQVGERTEDLEKINFQLYTQATVDSLTKIANRRSLETQFEMFIQLARRNHQPVSVMIADIDNFKKYNDEYGHPAGDMALITVAQKLDEVNRDADFIARYGGEEFAIILPNTDQDGALAAGEKFRHAIETISELDENVTMSFGVATMIFDRDTPFVVEEIKKTLIKQADEALYYSKKNGKNMVTHFRSIRRYS